MATPLFVSNSHRELCTSEDLAALRESYDSTRLQTFHHSMDNGFLDTSYGVTCENLRQSGYKAIGVCYNTPWVHQGRDCAIVYKDTNTEEVNWVHINDIILRVWNKEVDNEL